MWSYIYKKIVIDFSKLTLLLIAALICVSLYQSKNFNLDASSDALLLEGDKDLKYLRESGSIEQDADVVMFVYREAYYLERKQPKMGSIEHAEWQSKMNDVNGLADIILGKQRHGPTGTVKVEFEGIYTKFKDLSKN